MDSEIVVKSGYLVVSAKVNANHCEKLQHQLTKQDCFTLEQMMFSNNKKNDYDERETL